MTDASATQTLNIKLEFGGGTELLLAPPRSKVQRVSLPRFVATSSASANAAASTANANSAALEPSITAPASASAQAGAAGDKTTGTGEDIRAATMGDLVQFIRRNLIVEREELFVDADGVGIRPGILVLINDADWELEGELEYELQDGDEVCFISTLHGG